MLESLDIKINDLKFTYDKSNLIDFLRRCENGTLFEVQLNNKRQIRLKVKKYRAHLTDEFGGTNIRERRIKILYESNGRILTGPKPIRKLEGLVELLLERLEMIKQGVYHE